MRLPARGARTDRSDVMANVSNISSTENWKMTSAGNPTENQTTIVHMAALAAAGGTDHGKQNRLRMLRKRHHKTHEDMARSIRKERTVLL